MDLKVVARLAYTLCSEGFRNIRLLDYVHDGDYYRRSFQQDPHKDTYHKSMLYHLQATRPNPGSRTGRLRYFDGDSLISLGFGRDGTPAVAVGPMGKDAPLAVKDIAAYLGRQGIPLFVKKINAEKIEEYRHLGFRPVSYVKDFKPEDLPDDVFPEVVLHVQKFNPLSLGYREQKYIQKLKDNVRITWGRTRDLGDSDFARFKAFPEKWAVQKLERVKRQGGDPNLTALNFLEAYRPLLHPSRLLNAFYQMATSRSTGEVLGVGLAEYTSSETLAVLMGLTDTSNHYRGIEDWFDTQMISNIRNLDPNRVVNVNLGGSETIGLHQRKEKYRPHHTIERAYMVYDPANAGETEKQAYSPGHDRMTLSRTEPYPNWPAGRSLPRYCELTDYDISAELKRGDLWIDDGCGRAVALGGIPPDSGITLVGLHIHEIELPSHVLSFRCQIPKDRAALNRWKHQAKIVTGVFGSFSYCDPEEVPESLAYGLAMVKPGGVYLGVTLEERLRPKAAWDKIKAVLVAQGAKVLRENFETASDAFNASPEETIRAVRICAIPSREIDFDETAKDLQLALGRPTVQEGWKTEDGLAEIQALYYEAA